MKIISFFIGMLLSISNLTAQEKISKKYDTSTIDELVIELKFAHNIEIKNATDNEVLIEAKVNINKNKDNHFFNLRKNIENNTLVIESDYGGYFDNQKNNIIINGNDDTCVNCKDQNVVIVDYVLYIPKDKKLNIKSISGDVVTKNYNGLLNLDLVSGDITIKNHSKDMNLNTISGDVDIYINDATIKAETLTGTIYSDLNINYKHQEKQVTKNEIKGVVKNGLASLKIKTVSGNVFLRKI